ncbi:MAG: hypothetical protein LM582_09105 [Desulfurococcaceae archaeon]|nr:hypothetical protein [Desulfurococcaceae archaeon]
MDIVLISIYLMIMILLGVLASKRVSSVYDLYVGGLNIGGVATALSFFTTYFSSVIFVGATALGWKYGLLVLWKDIFVVIVGTLAAFVVIGPRVLALSRRYRIASIIDLIEIRYRSRAVSITASLTMFVGLYLYCISILIGMARALEASIGLSYETSLAISSIVTLVYIVLGGYIAQVWTQVLQAVFMLFMAVTLGVTSIVAVGGFNNLQNALASIDPSLATWPYRDTLPMFAFFLSLGFMGIGNPALLIKFISVKDRISLKKAVLISTATVAILTLSLNIASATMRIILRNSIATPDHAFIYFTKTILPKGFDTLLVIAILSASMSTLSAILNTLTHIARDTTARLLPRNPGNEMLFFRLTTLAIGITITIPALKPPEMLITLFGVTTSIISTVLVGPIIYGLFWRKASALGALVSMITSFAVAIAVNAYGGFRFPWTYYAFIPSIILSLTLLPLISIAIPSKNTTEHYC